MRKALMVLVAALMLGAAGPAHAFELWAVGDGADSGANDDAVATSISLHAPDRFLYLGDVYGPGDGQATLDDFNTLYDPGFGRMKSITSPTPGNHEIPTSAGYDPYWGTLAPQTNGGHYYSFDAGGWHIVSLSSEEAIGEGSAQLTWLRSDLAAHPGDCTLAFDHKPRFTDGLFKGKYETTLAPMWAALSGHAVAVLSGHDHNYQRFKPVDGLVQFVAGSGGHGFHTITPDSRLDAYNDTTYGALHLTLGAAQAAYEFVATDGTRVDSGGLVCTPPASPPPGGGDPPPTGGGTPPPTGGGTTPPPAGGTTPGGTTPAGSDTDPQVLIAAPRTGRVYSARLRLFRGFAEHVRGPVQLTLVRRAHGHCHAYGPHGFRYSCKKPPRLRAHAVAKWTMRLPRTVKLTPGVYTLTAGAGKASDLVRFRIR